MGFFLKHYIQSTTTDSLCIQCNNNDNKGECVPSMCWNADTMKGYIEERAVEIANYIIDNNATVRQTAKQFGISKSTVHKDVTERLAQINPSLAEKARVVLDLNKSERHIRGGLATKEKYLHKTRYNQAY
jgi:putative DeoR family transcriptional regulator (stage III sporulation protein D)